MKQVTYAGTTFTTGTAIADALLALVEALGASGGSASVRFPALNSVGDVTAVDVVVGPASEVVAVTVPSTTPELVDDEIVAGFEQRVRNLSHPRAVASSESPVAVWDDGEVADFR